MYKLPADNNPKHTLYISPPVWTQLGNRPVDKGSGAVPLTKEILKLLPGITNTAFIERVITAENAGNPLTVNLSTLRTLGWHWDKGDGSSTKFGSFFMLYKHHPFPARDIVTHMKNLHSCGECLDSPWYKKFLSKVAESVEHMTSKQLNLTFDLGCKIKSKYSKEVLFLAIFRVWVIEPSKSCSYLLFHGSTYFSTPKWHNPASMRNSKHILNLADLILATRTVLQENSDANCLEILKIVRWIKKYTRALIYARNWTQIETRNLERLATGLKMLSGLSSKPKGLKQDLFDSILEQSFCGALVITQEIERRQQEKAQIERQWTAPWLLVTAVIILATLAIGFLNLRRALDDSDS